MSYPRQTHQHPVTISSVGKLHFMTWSERFSEKSRLVMATSELITVGASWRSLQKATESGALIRVRRGYYTLPAASVSVREAVRVGGRLACVSAAIDEGIFGFDDGAVHVHVLQTASRLGSPEERALPVLAHGGKRATVHWGSLLRPSAGTEYRVGLMDAIRQIFLCQNHRIAMASLESALHLGLLSRAAIPVIFSALPEPMRYLMAEVDARADSGQETVLRLLVKEAGFSCDFQHVIAGIGRVDLLVEGCIVVEADSRQFHDGWEAHSRDRTRDTGLAALGYMSLRVLYRDIMFHPESIVSAIQGLLDAR
jgi:very-short-patch-repair endonuclease